MFCVNGVPFRLIKDCIFLGHYCVLDTMLITISLGITCLHNRFRPRSDNLDYKYHTTILLCPEVGLVGIAFTTWMPIQIQCKLTEVLELDYTIGKHTSWLRSFRVRLCTVPTEHLIACVLCLSVNTWCWQQSIKHLWLGFGYTLFECSHTTNWMCHFSIFLIMKDDHV